MPFDPSSNRRRKRVRHYDVPGHAHFLTFSCYKRMQLLSKDRTRQWLVDSIDDARRKHEFDLWAWVIMPEHAHLLIYPRRPIYSTAKIVGDIKRPLAQKAIDFLRQNRPEFLSRLRVVNKNRVYYRFWQAGPGFDRNIEDPSAAPEVVEYIHYNPLRRKLVVHATDWRWSSAAAWEGKECLLTIDRTIPGIIVCPGS